MESLEGKKALLCEDNELNTEILTILLKEKGIDVETAENGQAGFEKFANSMTGYYDVILMDIRMPVLDGYSATEKIRALARSDAKRIPIIAMTADVFESEVHHAEEVGMNGYLAKPIERKKLYNTLYETINKHMDEGKEEK